MILNNRKFEREPPTRSSKSIYIIAEGLKREYQYFNFFREIDSRINVEVYKLSSHENNSPGGLLNIAENMTSGESNKCLVEEGDELWIVFDTDKDKRDSRSEQIRKLRAACADGDGWNTAQSNPCFEVWLHHHFNDSLPELEDIAVAKHWKKAVADLIKGGFNSGHHPLLIEDARDHALANFSEKEGLPIEGATEIHMLASSILEVIGNKISQLRKASQLV